MIILHFHLQPQFIYELFHINFTSKLRNNTSTYFYLLFFLDKIQNTSWNCGKHTVEITNWHELRLDINRWEVSRTLERCKQNEWITFYCLRALLERVLYKSSHWSLYIFLTQPLRQLEHQWHFHFGNYSLNCHDLFTWLCIEWYHTR